MACACVAGCFQEAQMRWRNVPRHNAPSGSGPGEGVEAVFRSYNASLKWGDRGGCESTERGVTYVAVVAGCSGS